MKINEENLYTNYQKWVEEEHIVVLKDLVTNEIIKKQSPRRGNSAYARKFDDKRKKLESQFTKLTFSTLIENSRKNYSDSLLLLITLTYDHKKTDIQNSWRDITKEINNFKKKIRRRLGFGATVICSKEGTKSGYPAPHLLIMLDRPLRTTRYHGRWIVQSKSLVDKLRDCWPNGFIDVRAIGPEGTIEGRSPISYVMKYLIKSVKSDGKFNQIALKQLAWQKLFNLRPFLISGQFKNRLNPVRLDSFYYNSCHPSDISNKNNSNWTYEKTLYCKNDELLAYLNGLNPSPSLLSSLKLLI